MNSYKIDVCAIGSYWEFDVNCPPEWRGSGCYDERHECWQEAQFVVWAESKERALQLICYCYEECDKEWCINPHKFYYDPTTLKERIGDDIVEETIFFSDFAEPVEGTECPERYTATAHKNDNG